MKHFRLKHISLLLVTISCSLTPRLHAALTITENFSGTNTTNKWFIPNPPNGTDNTVCLTAGNNTNLGNATTAGSPKKCTTVTDNEGEGALRLTSAQTWQTGAIISDFTFPTNEGVEISFTTYTYGGSGADGITFFLTDGDAPLSLGAHGGSLGYSCRNNSDNPNGIIGGYLGLGIDEQGNFLNQGDNTSTGFNHRGNRIGLRGAGITNWYNLNKLYPSYYPSTLNSMQQRAGVYHTCRTGSLHRFEDGYWYNTGVKIFNYNAFPSPVNLPVPIGSGQKVRNKAIPINYRLKITTGGLLSLWWSYNGGVYQPMLTDQDIVKSNGPLPKTFRFGFSSATGSATNNHEITCFKAAPVILSGNSAAIGLPTGEYRTGAQIYTTLYSSNNWWAQLTSNNLAYKDNGKIEFDPKANWDASCVLTGGVCDNTGGNIVSAQSPNSREMLTYNGNKGVPFRWSDGLESIQQGYLNAGDSKGELRLQYLRGDRTNEMDSLSNGLFRKRTSVLGDIINSSPAWVGSPTTYAGQENWSDQLNPTMTMPENSGQTYQQFQNKYNNRLNVLYIGSNDGLMHGFRSGAYDSTGKTYTPTADKPNDGKEVLAYMPSTVLKNIHNGNVGLDFSNPNYGHNFFNDATPGTGDLFYGGKWHTWLISGLGFGGSTIYALDITDPMGEDQSSKAFKEINANNIVKGEWSYSTSDPIWKYLGNTHGTPKIRRFHNGQWGAIFGNGWCNASDANNGNCSMTSSGQAGIYIMLIDQTTGKPTFHFINTGTGSASDPNGIGYVTPADLDNDKIVDYVYAGDLKGNVWRFDITDSNPDNWKTSSAKTKLFTTPGNQPITTQIAVVAANSTVETDKPRVIISFGTGKQTPGYLLSGETYETSTQNLYGIWDWNLSDWNAKGSATYAALDSISSTITKASLTQQTVNTSNDAISNNNVCWADNAKCTGSDARYGWYINLQSLTANGNTSYEQVIYNPIISSDAILINTIIPGKELTISCESVGSSGYTYALSPANGGGIPGFFNNNFDDETGYRLGLSASGMASLIKVDDKLVMVTKNAKGEVTLTPVYKKPPIKFGRRINWIELR